MSQPVVRVISGEPLAPHLLAGGVVALGPGVHAGGLTLESSVTLRGEPGAILDAGRSGPVITVDADGLSIRLEGLTLRNGAGEAGGGIRMSGWSDLVVERCVIEGNEASLGGGGAGGGAYVHRGSLMLIDTEFRNNRARMGADLYVTGAARAEARGGRFGGDVAVLEGADVTFVGSQIEGALVARGTTTQSPSLTLRGTRVAGGVHNDANLPANLILEDG